MTHGETEADWPLTLKPSAAWYRTEANGAEDGLRLAALTSRRAQEQARVHADSRPPGGPDHRRCSVWQGVCGGVGGALASTQPPDSLHPSLLLPSHFPFGGNYLFLKRAPEQTRWEIPPNKPSLFPGSLSLALQTKLVGRGWDFPRPLLVWEGLPGGGSSQECQAAAAAAPLLTAGRAGALPPRSRESQPPPLQAEGT